MELKDRSVHWIISLTPSDIFDKYTDDKKNKKKVCQAFKYQSNYTLNSLNTNDLGR